MRSIVAISVATVALSFSTTIASAWWDTGHMAVAGIAYDHLDPQVRSKVDALIKLNPDYGKWIAGVAPADKGKFAFMRAALWPDDIKKQGSGYTRNKVSDPAAGENNGYGDMVQHDYWHYVDIPFTKDGSLVKAPPVPNALTQMRLLTRTLGDPTATDDVRSFDLVWIEHIVGDLHQPLHGTAMFGKTLPADGDQGGNKVGISAAGTTANNLHAYWDGLLGGTADGAVANPKDAITLIGTLPPADPKAAAILDPGSWLVESFTLAQTVVYAKPVGDGVGPYTLDQAYMTTALATAKAQASLAGLRLANLLNEVLE